MNSQMPFSRADHFYILGSKNNSYVSEIWTHKYAHEDRGRIRLRSTDGCLEGRTISDTKAYEATVDIETNSMFGAVWESLDAEILQ